MLPLNTGFIYSLAPQLKPRCVLSPQTESHHEQCFSVLLSLWSRSNVVSQGVVWRVGEAHVVSVWTGIKRGVFSRDVFFLVIRPAQQTGIFFLLLGLECVDKHSLPKQTQQQLLR